MPDTRLGQWMEDFRWAMNVMRARRYRRELIFSKRVAFDEALRPRLARPVDGVGGGPIVRGTPVSVDVIAYPDAFYRVTVDDVIRAATAAVRHV